MAWSPLATQFCLELAFGVLFGLALIPKAPMGTFFYRMMGTTALLPLACALVAPPIWTEGAAWTDGGVILAGAAALLFPVYSGPVKGTTRQYALIAATVLTGGALVFALAPLPAADGAGALALASLSAMSTGLVAGGVGLAMVVGHWYLTVPQLPVSWLVRLNRLTAWAMIASVLFLVLTCMLHSQHFADARTPLLGPWGLFYLGGRVAVGLALPLLFAWMTAGSLKYENTRSATGILYASTVLVLIGTALSISLQDSYGVPL
jgi:hypothetical protein